MQCHIPNEENPQLHLCEHFISHRYILLHLSHTHKSKDQDYCHYLFNQRWDYRKMNSLPIYFPNHKSGCSLTLFIHFVVCLMTGPKPFPKWPLHIVQSRASSFKWEYPLLSLRSSISFLRLLPHLPVTSILPFILLSITRCRRQFLCIRCVINKFPDWWLKTQKGLP